MCPSGYFTRGTLATSTVSNCMVSRCRHTVLSHSRGDAGAHRSADTPCLRATSNVHFHSLGLYIHFYLLTNQGDFSSSARSKKEVGAFIPRFYPNSPRSLKPLSDLLCSPEPLPRRAVRGLGAHAPIRPLKYPRKSPKNPSCRSLSPHRERTHLLLQTRPGQLDPRLLDALPRLRRASRSRG